MGAGPAYALRLNAAELLRQPGSTKPIEVTVDPAHVGVTDDRITGAVRVALLAVSNVDGVVVTGTIATPWRVPCRRCLVTVEGVQKSAVDELYQREVSGDDAFEIVGDQIDLVPVVREHVLLDLPDAPLCRPDCAGICPVCGADRNAAPCDCDTSVRDERWAALDELRVDDPPPDS